MKHAKWLIPLILLLAGCGGSSHPAHQPSRAARLAHTLPNGQPAPASWTVHGGRPRSPAFVAGAEALGALTLSPAGGSSVLFGYDAVTLRNILVHTSSPQAVGCYVVGTFANCSEARSRFPHAHIVSITPTASFVSISAKCLDTETGDSTPGQVAGWIRAEIRVGVYRPCDYAPLDEMVFQVEPLLRASGLARSAYLLWVAHWTNVFGIESGFDAQQFLSNAFVDEDAFPLYFFATKPAPPPVPLCSRTMCYPKFASGGSGGYRSGGLRGGPFYNKTGSLCHHGCDERQFVYWWQHAQSSTHAHRLWLRYRIQWLHNVVQGTIDHSTVTQNKAKNRYRRSHIAGVIGYGAVFKHYYNSYLEVKS